MMTEKIKLEDEFVGGGNVFSDMVMKKDRVKIILGRSLVGEESNLDDGHALGFLTIDGLELGIIDFFWQALKNQLAVF